MFDTLLKKAHESGAEVVLDHQLYGNILRGRVFDINDTHFTLFNSGSDGGILWAFRLVDVQYVGLVLELPQSLTGHVTSTSSPDEASTESQHPSRGKGFSYEP